MLLGLAEQVAFGRSSWYNHRIVAVCSAERGPTWTLSSPRAGRLQLTIGPSGPWLEMSVSDDGQGVPQREVEHYC